LFLIQDSNIYDTLLTVQAVAQMRLIRPSSICGVIADRTDSVSRSSAMFICQIMDIQRGEGEKGSAFDTSPSHKNCCAIVETGLEHHIDP
jgi:hypothetical protein